jgi:tRNA(His) guanylyltransferase
LTHYSKAPTNYHITLPKWQTQSKCPAPYCVGETQISRYEYVKTFEQPDTLLPNTWIVVRIDGRGFHKSDYFSASHFPPNFFLSLQKKKYIRKKGLTTGDRFTTRYNFEKPNDRRGIDLMNAAAKAVMGEVPDLVIAYGISDEYSFVFHRSSTLFERRSTNFH